MKTHPRLEVAEPPKLWTVEGLAEYLGVPVQTIYRWNSRGQGPPYVRLGKHARYRPADVDAWLDTRATSA